MDLCGMFGGEYLRGLIEGEGAGRLRMATGRPVRVRDKRPAMVCARTIASTTMCHARERSPAAPTARGDGSRQADASAWDPVGAVTRSSGRCQQAAPTSASDRRPQAAATDASGQRQPAASDASDRRPQAAATDASGQRQRVAATDTSARQAPGCATVCVKDRGGRHRRGIVGSCRRWNVLPLRGLHNRRGWSAGADGQQLAARWHQQSAAMERCRCTVPATGADGRQPAAMVGRRGWSAAGGDGQPVMPCNYRSAADR